MRAVVDKADIGNIPKDPFSALDCFEPFAHHDPSKGIPRSVQGQHPKTIVLLSSHFRLDSDSPY